MPFIPSAALLSTGGTLPFINVKDAPYRAKGDGVTDDTAAIQAALDAAGTTRGIVVIPGSETDYLFSNLKIPAYVRLMGAGIQSTKLTRIVGSTGLAIREKTAGEGNVFGATAIKVSDVQINGNGTVGNGIDIGFQNPAYTLASGGTVSSAYVWNFPSGIGIHIAANAESFYYLWALSCQDGIVFEGGGANQVFAPYAENNSRYQLHVKEPHDEFYGVQIESNVSNATELLRIDQSFLAFSGVYINYSGAATKAAMILNATGCNNNIVRDASLLGLKTHGILHEVFASGTGSSDQQIAEWVVGTNTNTSSWWINGSTGAFVKRFADLADLGALEVNATQLGFFGTAAASKPTVTGSRGGNAALASLLTQLASLGLITDSSS